MKESPSGEANRFSASQEIPCIVWKPKVHYRIYKYPKSDYTQSILLIWVEKKVYCSTFK